MHPQIAGAVLSGPGKTMKHFKLSEFTCPCCGGNQMQIGFLIKLDEARELAGIPFHINSGWRCEAHNQEVGGSPTSSHMLGWAADIKAVSGHDKFKVVMAARDAGITRIGVYKNFIHLDTDPGEKQEIIFPGKD